MIDDTGATTLAATSTLNPEIRAALNGDGGNVEGAKLVGAKIAELCKQANIEKVWGCEAGGSLPAGARPRAGARRRRQRAAGRVGSCRGPAAWTEGEGRVDAATCFCMLVGVPSLTCACHTPPPLLLCTGVL